MYRLAAHFACLLLLFSVSAPASISPKTTTSDALPKRVEQTLQRLGFSGDGLSVVVQEIGVPEPLLAYQADIPRNPASVIKMLTTLVALDQLTPAYRWKTMFYADGEIKEGVLTGDLIIQGGGDPYLPLEKFGLMVKQLYDTGLRQINGNIVIDQSLFQAIDEDPGHFDGQPLRAYNVVPSALISNFNVSRLTFRPDEKTKRVRVEVYPPLDHLQIQNRLRIKKGACVGYNRGIDVEVDNNGVLHVAGNFPSGCSIFSLYYSIADKNAYTVSLFRHLWQQLGGRWSGQWLASTSVSAAKLDSLDTVLAFESEPLGQAIHSINKYSNNVMSRMLFLTLGMAQEGPPATSEKSRRAIAHWVKTQQIDMPGLRPINGAGRSRDVRVSARGINNMLQTAWQSLYMPEFISSLSLSGLDGTFGRRHRNGLLKGVIHAKTGRLNNVVALAGYYQSPQKRRYTFAILHNARDIHRGHGNVVQDAILYWLSNSVQ